MFDSLLGFGKDVFKVADAAIEIPVGLARTITKPIGDAAEELKEDIEDLLDE